MGYSKAELIRSVLRQYPEWSNVDIQRWIKKNSNVDVQSSHISSERGRMQGVTPPPRKLSLNEAQNRVMELVKELGGVERAERVINMVNELYNDCNPDHITDAFEKLVKLFGEKKEDVAA